jgi:hypothetical protein
MQHLENKSGKKWSKITVEQKAKHVCFLRKLIILVAKSFTIEAVFSGNQSIGTITF